jgi:ketosteroid isomerase-like protein
MPQSDVDLIRATYDAFARGDVPAVLANFAEDIEWHAPDVLPHGMDVRGREAVGAFFAGLVAQWSDFGLEIEDLVAAPTAVLCRGRASGTLNGTPTGYGFVHAFTIRDGKVARFDEYVAPPQGGFPQP